MAPYQIFSMMTRLVCGVICTALTFLVLLQLRHDKKSRLFAILTGIIAVIALNGLLLRLIWELDGDIFVLFTLAGVLTGALPFIIFLFTNEYLETWTRSRRIIAQILAAYVILGAIAGMMLKMVSAATISPEGYVIYQMYPWTSALLSGGILVSVLTELILLQQYRKRHAGTNIRVLVGIGLMTVGVLLLAVPDFEKYTLEQVFYAVGAMIVVGPVFQQRLFDPLTQVNRQLARRADQLSAITRVGQQATSLMQPDLLLNAIVCEIQLAFGYDAVIIYQLNASRTALVGRAGAGWGTVDPSRPPVCAIADDSSTVGIAATTRQATQTTNLRRPLQPALRSEASIPLVMGDGTSAEEDLIGVLDIQSARPNAFEPEDMAVLHILANQIATAIHNAELFAQAQQARQTADEASRQKTRFLASMSHELRTPLQTIVTRTQWMLAQPDMYSGVPLPEAYRSDLNAVEQSSLHLRHLINSVLDLTKIEAGELDLELTAVDPVELLREVLKTSTSLLKPGVTLRSEFPEQLPAIWADDLRIKQVLDNIVSNACKFCEQGHIIVDAQVSDNKLCFKVADTGIGIAPEAQSLLFNRFRQADRNIARQYGGSGLGLSISKQLVQLHGGDIWLHSKPGEGSTFFFTVPLSSTTIPASCPAYGDRVQPFIFPISQRHPPNQVLIIGANPAWQQQLDAALTQHGYLCLMAHDADRGLVWAEALLPSVIVLFQSPGAGQSSFAEQLAEIPIIEVPPVADETACIHAVCEALHQQILGSTI